MAIFQGMKRFVLIHLLIQMILPRSLEGFSLTPRNDDKELGLLSRRQLLTLPIGIGGAFLYGELVADAAKKLSRGNLVYPEAHERRVESIISKATVASIPQDLLTSGRPLRVLEVGTGKDWRVERRGLYHTALDQLSARGISKIELTGLDVVAPTGSSLEEAERKMKRMSSESQIDVDLHVLEASITAPVDFPDGWFDCVICSLTLCSVDNQNAAIQEIKRLVRPDGGTFGFVEHVAVMPSEPYRLLEFQQNFFDPLQQAVADNCHLHRFTDDNIAKSFEIENNSISSRLYFERYLVDDMWPISCQCCGVIQRKT